MSWSKPPVLIQSSDQDSSLLPSGYVLKHKALSSKTVVVDLFWRDKKQLAFIVNEHVFNPIESIVGHKFIDLVLSGKVDVTDKSVIDLGCGSGVIGLCAIRMKASKILFTDINPHIDGIQKHPLFRSCDEWQIQDVLAEVPDSSYDTVLVIPPSVLKEGEPIAFNTFESGVFRDSNLYNRILGDSGRVLRPGGQLVIWLRIPLTSFESFVELLKVAAAAFDMTTTTLLAHGIESCICLDHEESLLSRWMYKFQKAENLNDSIWLILSLTRKNSSI